MRNLICFWVVVCVILGPSLSRSTESLSGIGWVGLFHEDMLQWLENENRLAILCPDTMGPARQQCRDEKLKPRTWAIDVRENPDAASPSLGTIEITAGPGSGLTAVFRTPAESTAFIPDLFESDWGYGPYFHQTFLDKKQEWFRLPQNPLPRSGWINLAQLTETPDVIPLTERQIYDFAGHGIVITKLHEDAITIRPEQPGDMWCKNGRPPRMKALREQKISIPYIFSPDGHLVLKIKYMRGC